MSRIIFICHPWRGTARSHNDTNYPELTKQVCRHIALNSDDIPLSTGLYLNQFLSDGNHKERELGIKLGHELMEVCDVVYSYEMHGISQGMKQDLEYAKILKKSIEIFHRYPWQ